MDPPQTTSGGSGSGSGSGGTTSTKLRLMCSYGGQIVPRPNGTNLCYSGGDTRIVAIDRRSVTLPSLTSHLSRNLLNSRPFSLKYQLPNDDLDSLVSITTDEDLVNMIDEYDRLALSPTPSRLRFFLFPTSPKAADQVYDARSEAWFFDSLRSAGIDGGGCGKRSSGGSSCGGESDGKGGGVLLPGESIVLETNSSFGSTGSAASVSNSAAVKGGGGEEVGLVQVQDSRVNLLPMDSIGSEASFTSSNFQSPNLVYLDSPDQSDPTKDAKIPSKLLGTESNFSDVSPCADLLTPMQVYGYSVSQPMDQLQQQPLPIQQPLLKPQPQPALQSYLQPSPQYIHAASPYAPQYYPSAVPTAGYPTAYHPYLHQHQQQTAYTINKPYPYYLMPVGQAQPHNLPIPHSLAGTPVISPAGAQLQSAPPIMMTSKVVYDGFPALSTPELVAAKTYGTGPVSVVSQPVPVAVQSEESKFTAVAAQISLPTPTQAVAVSSVVEGAKYGCGVSEYDDPLHAQIYKTQPSAPAVRSQFQPMTNAASVMLSDKLSQLQLDNTKQQVRT